MSASRDKKLRKANAPAEPIETQNNNEEKNSDLRYKIAGIVVIVAILASLVFFVVNTFVTPNMAALKVGDENVYDHELNYYYVNSYSNFLNQTGEYAASLFGLNSSVSLKQQTYYADESMTWHDYFLDTAKNSAQQIHMLVDEANKAGFTLTEEYQGYVADEMTALNDYVAETYPDADVDSYLKAMYGNRMDSAEYERLVTNGYIATLYQTEKLEQMTDSITEADIETYYNEHKTDFDMVTYRRYLVSAEIEDDMTEDQQTAALDSAKATAANLAAAATSEAEFIAQVVTYQNQVNERVAANSEPDEDGNLPEVVVYTGEQAETDTLYSNATRTTLSAEMGDWLFDEARTTGDVTTVDSTNGTYILLFMERSRYDYNTKDVRHILVGFDEYDAEGNPIDPNAPVEETTEGTETTDTTTETAVTDAQDAAAKAEAESILAEYEAGEQTEEAFAELAKKYSYDGNAAEGGIYEEVYQGQMVPNFETWCYGSGRQHGDTGIVSSDYGYHVMFFVGDSTPYWQVQVRDAKASADYSAWQTAQLENYEVSEKGGIANVGIN